MKKISIPILSTLILGVILYSCGTSTKITAFWSEKNYDKGHVKKVLIMGIAKREAVRRSFEEDMVKKLEFYGVEGIPSSEVFPFDVKLDTNSFRLHFKNDGFDALLTSQLVSADKDVRYESGSAYYGHRGMYGYYGSSWDNMYSPGYAYTTTTIKIETNLYDAKSEKLIWSAISETFDPIDEIDIIRSLNQRISSELNKQGFFYKAP